MKKYLAIVTMLVVFVACSNKSEKKEEASTENVYVPEKSAEATPSEEEIKKIDPNRGIGKFTDVDLSPTLDQQMATSGKSVYDVKCASCHRLDETRLVGPGWKGVTTRRTPEWIMNFSTNTDEMLNRDPAAQAMLEICLVRMPNQNLNDDDARHVLEFMRQNDGVK